MTAALVLGLSFGMILLRRRSVAIALVGVQSLVLGILAFDHGGEFPVAGLVLVVKAIALPALLAYVWKRTQEQRLVAAPAGPLMRFAFAAAAAGLAVAVLPPLGTDNVDAERAAVATTVIGLTTVVARRPALFQLLGMIVAENGISLLALTVPGGLSYVIELGALFDLALVVVVASFFTNRIHATLGTGDTELLRGLRD